MNYIVNGFETLCDTERIFLIKKLSMLLFTQHFNITKSKIVPNISNAIRARHKTFCK